MYNILRKAYVASVRRRLPVLHSLIKPSLDALFTSLGKMTGMALPSYKYIGCDVKLQLLLGYLDSETFAVCKTFLRPGINVLDIGAHCGYYSRFFSERVGPDGIVYAFEPHPENYRLLCRNTTQKRYQNVRTIQYAISDSIGKTELFEMAASSSQHSLYNVSKYLSHYTFARKLNVNTVTVDAFLAEQGNQEESI